MGMTGSSGSAPPGASQWRVVRPTARGRIQTKTAARSTPGERFILSVAGGEDGLGGVP